MNEFIDLKEEELNTMNGIRSLYKGNKCPNGSTASGSTRVVAMALENDVGAPGRLLDLHKQAPSYINPSVPPSAEPRVIQPPAPCGI